MSRSSRVADSVAQIQRSMTARPEVDMVNSPPHYNQGDIECIDAIRAQLGLSGFIAYLRGTIAKYNWRLLHKHNPVQDSEKMEWYQKKLIEALREAAAETSNP